MNPALVGLVCLLAGLVIGGAWGYVGGLMGNLMPPRPAELSTKGQQFTNRPVVPIVLAEPPQPTPSKWGWK